MPVFFSVLLITPHQSTGVGYNFVIMCTNITLTCTINLMRGKRSTPEVTHGTAHFLVPAVPQGDSNIEANAETLHQSTVVAYNFVIMCLNITLTCTINFIGSAQTSPELWVFYWASTSATVLHIPVSAHAHAYNSGLVWALPIELMWQVSVIFVHMTTALYPTPGLWCGVIRKTVEKVGSFSCCWTAQNAQTFAHNSL